VNLYYQNIRYIGGITKPPVFFENVWNQLHPANFRILLVEGAPAESVGGIGFFAYGQKIHLAYFGIDRDTHSTKYSLLPLLCWHSIKWAEENNFRYVCFGSTPAYPKTPAEILNYSQKMMFGGLFLNQETVFIPYDLRARAIVSFRKGTSRPLKMIKNALPLSLQKSIEKRAHIVF
jgi:hypothetical protein